MTFVRTNLLNSGITRRNNLIPKYLIARKIEIIRRKIITRKFGYLFYRKTVSPILPSVATKYYLNTLLNNAFHHWLNQWYDRTIGWKLWLKAEIHYNLKLECICLRRWKQFCEYRKSVLLKYEVAAIYYNQHEKCFIVKRFFQKWKWFVQHKKEVKELRSWAWNYFKENHYPTFLKPYFHRWMILLRAGQKLKCLMGKVYKTYETKLIKRSLETLKEYRIKRLIVKENIKKSEDHFKMTMQRKCLNTWKNYLIDKLNRKTNKFLAEANYRHQLKRHCFHKLLLNVLRNKFLCVVLQAIDLSILKSTFKKWLLFVKITIRQKEKDVASANFRRYKLKRMVFSSMKSYTKYRREKKCKNAILLLASVEHLKRKKMKFCLQQWKRLSDYKKKKELKLNSAIKLYNLMIYKKALKNWIEYLQNRKLTKNKFVDAEAYYNTRLKRHYFHLIRFHTQSRKRFQNMIEFAKMNHKSNAISEVVAVICLAGLEEKNRLFSENMEKYRRQLHLAEKYFSVWKNKTIYQSVVLRNREESAKYCETDIEFSSCFLLPKL